MTASLEGISEETIELIKAQTSGVNSTTGVFGVDLAGLISLVPVVTPFRDQLARTTPEQGALVAQWRALLNVNNSQPDPSMAFDAAANLAVLQEMDVYAGYKPLGMGYTVTEDSIYLAKGYADAKAIAIFNALNQWKIGEDRKALGGQNFALATPSAPTLTTATTGGSIGATVTVHVGVAARTIAGYFYGGNGKGAAASIATGAGTTNSVTATVTAVRGAVAYDWFYSADGATWYYYTTTTVNTATITATIAANNALPQLVDLSSTVPTYSSTTDHTAKSAEFNGLLATLAGDYGSNSLVTPGSGTASGAQFISLDGGTLTLSGGGISQIDQLLLSIYNYGGKVSPSALMLSSQEASNISSKILGTNSATTFLEVNDVTGRSEAVASGYIGTYINRAAAGARVKLEVHPNLPPGTIIARTDRVPYPNSNISNVLELRVLKDASEYVYGSDRTSGGPREDGEVRSLETFINRAPVAMGVIQNIANG